MLRKRRVTLNGVELPEEFSGASIINNIAISPDGEKYAYIKNGALLTGDMPEDGVLDVNGIVINYKKSAHGLESDIDIPGIIMDESGIYIGSRRSGVHIDRGTGSVRSSSMIISGGRSISIGGENLEYEINENYANVKKLSLEEHNNDILMQISDDDCVYVKGFTGKEPTFEGERLFISGLEGELTLPKYERELEVDIETHNGSIKGEVAHKGKISTHNGRVYLELRVPLAVRVTTHNGEIDVRGMASQGRGLYTPIGEEPESELRIKTHNGDIDIRYLR